jgi:hypothetical protein
VANRKIEAGSGTPEGLTVAEYAAFVSGASATYIVAPVERIAVAPLRAQDEITAIDESHGGGWVPSQFIQSDAVYRVEQFRHRLPGCGLRKVE